MILVVQSLQLLKRSTLASRIWLDSFASPVVSYFRNKLSLSRTLIIAADL